jgi:hypothetical protein
MSDPNIKRLTIRDISGTTENLEYMELKWDKLYDEVVLRLKDNAREHIIPLRNIGRLSHRPEVKLEEPATEKPVVKK